MNRFHKICSTSYFGSTLKKKENAKCLLMNIN